MFHANNIKEPFSGHLNRFSIFFMKKHIFFLSNGIKKSLMSWFLILFCFHEDISEILKLWKLYIITSRLIKLVQKIIQNFQINQLILKSILYSLIFRTIFAAVYEEIFYFKDEVSVRDIQILSSMKLVGISKSNFPNISDEDSQFHVFNLEPEFQQICEDFNEDMFQINPINSLSIVFRCSKQINSFLLKFCHEINFDLILSTSYYIFFGVIFQIQK
jgi:hypothetical protein